MRRLIFGLCFFALLCTKGTLSADVDALFKEIADDYVQRVQSLLERDFSGLRYYEIVNGSNWTVLHVAAHFGSEKVIEFLLPADRTSDQDLKKLANAENDLGRMPLFYAAGSKSTASAQKILLNLLDFNVEVGHSDKFGMQPVHVAIQARNSNSLNSLISLGGDRVSKAVHEGKSISHMAAEYNFVEFLVESWTYFDESSIDNQGQIPACWAAINGSVQFAREMLKRSLFINGGNCSFGLNGEKIGQPILAATYYRQEAFVSFLLDETNVDVSAVDLTTGGNALHLIAESQLTNRSSQELDESIASRLCKKQHALVEMRDSKGRTPFLAAVSSSRLSFAKFLRLTCSADAAAVDSQGYSALHLSRDAATTDFLMHPALFTDINWRSDDPEEELTPLHVAILETKPIEFVKFLLNGHKADPTIVDKKNGSTALHMAVEVDYHGAVEAIMAEKQFKTALSMREKVENLTPLQLAIKLGRDKIATTLISSDLFETMVNEVVSDETKQTAFHMAAELDREQVVKALMDQISKTDFWIWDQNARGDTALHTAVIYDAVRVFKAIVNSMSMESVQEAVSAQDMHRRTVIHLLATKCSNGSLEIAQTLAKTHAFKLTFNLNEKTRDIFDETALETAVKRNCDSMVELFLHMGSDQQCKAQNKREGLTALHTAKLLGFDRLVDKMVATGRCSLDQLDRQKRSVTEVDPMKEDSEETFKERIERLEKELAQQINAVHGEIMASIPIPNGYVTELPGKKSQLTFACADGFQLSGEAVVERNRASWKPSGYCSNQNLDTNLFFSAHNGSVELVRSLLDKGANLEATFISDLHYIRGVHSNTWLSLNRGTALETDNSNGLTPLFLAAGRGHWKVVRLLLDRGANFEAKNSNGLTPLHWASFNPFFTSSSDGLEVIRLLLDRGANVDDIDDYGKTPLMRAVYWDKLDVVKLLVDREANIHFNQNLKPWCNCTCDSSTPLACATSKGYTPIAVYLSSQGAYHG